MAQQDPTESVSWSGHLISVQPRIRLTRSFDQRHHSYLGYVLAIDGVCGDNHGQFNIAIGKGAQEKHSFQIGMEVSGQSSPVEDPALETASYYKTCKLRVGRETADPPDTSPPFCGVPPELPTYRARGHRRLDAKTFASNCITCIWGCRMPVAMIVDQWNPSKQKLRFETFCYGPKNCSLYRAGPNRKVPGRRGMSYTEEDWVDEEATSHRGLDE